MNSIKSRNPSGVSDFSSPDGIMEDLIDCNWAMLSRLTFIDMLKGILILTELELWLESMPT